MSAESLRFSIKICGVRSVDDARRVVDAGADAIGLNFVPGRARAIDLALAETIVVAVASQISIVAVVADASDTLFASLQPLGFDAFQLHGNESPARCAELGQRGLSPFKAVSVRGPTDVAGAHAYPGSHVLFDAAAPPGQAAGGSGHGFDWSWLRDASPRPYWLAGGLTPDNVAAAVLQSRTSGVDVASGVEKSVGVKDATKVGAFVAAARAAFSERVRAAESSTRR